MRTCSPTSRPAISHVEVTIAFKSICSGSKTCCLLNASNWPVRVAACWAARSIWRTVSRSAPDRARAQIVEEDDDHVAPERIGGQGEASVLERFVSVRNDSEVTTNLGDRDLAIRRCKIGVADTPREVLADQTPDDERRLDPERVCARAVCEDDPQARRVVRVFEVEDVCAERNALEQRKDLSLCERRQSVCRVDSS
jgi:hypothetical protein